jgi:hypothetical protein
VQLGIAFMEVGMWKTSCRAVYWTELDCVALVLSFLHLDFSRRNLDDFSTPSCKCWSTDHYPIRRKLH